MASTSASASGATKSLRGPPGHRVDLHQLDLPARGGDFVQPIAKRLQLRGRRRLARHAHEQRLDHQRPHPRRGGDVVQNLLKRNRRAVDELEILFRAGFELGPDLAVVGVEDRQPSLARAAGGTCWRW